MGCDQRKRSFETDPRARDTDERAYEVEVYQADDGSIIDMWGGTLRPDEIVADLRAYAALIREPTASTDPE